MSKLKWYEIRFMIKCEEFPRLSSAIIGGGYESIPCPELKGLIKRLGGESMYSFSIRAMTEDPIYGFQEKPYIAKTINPTKNNMSKSKCCKAEITSLSYQCKKCEAYLDDNQQPFNASTFGKNILNRSNSINSDVWKKEKHLEIDGISMNVEGYTQKQIDDIKSFVSLLTKKKEDQKEEMYKCPDCGYEGDFLVHLKEILKDFHSQKEEEVQMAKQIGKKQHCKCYRGGIGKVCEFCLETFGNSQKSDESKSQSWEEEFDELMEDVKLHSEGLPCFRDALREMAIKNLIQKSLNKERKRCADTSSFDIPDPKSMNAAFCSGYESALRDMKRHILNPNKN